MSTELLVIGGKGITELKEQLPSIKPTKSIAVRWLNLKSLVTGKAGEDFTKACNQHLMECKDCEEVYEDGFGVKLITTEKKVYKSTAAVKAAEKAVAAATKALTDAKLDLDNARAKAGFTLEADKAYYKAI